MNILNGIKELLQSPSGVFGILTLICITVVTWHSPSVGGTAFAAFVAIVPAILGVCEHREQMQVNQQQINVIGTFADAAPPERSR